MKGRGRTSSRRCQGYSPPVEQLALFSLPPTPVRADVRRKESTRILTRLKILAGIVALGVVREEPAAAREFLEAVDRSSLHERDRASVRQLVRSIGGAELA